MFANKVIIVTGAAGNVGSALAKLLASRAARVVLVDTVRDRLAVVAGSLEGNGHLAFSDYDLTNSAAAEALVTKVQSDCGRLDGVGATVGGFTMARLADTGPEQWEAMFRLNVMTTWNIYRAAVPAIRQAGGGALVGIASAAGLRGSAQMAAYSATKSAVMRLTESLADELRGDRIRVNATGDPSATVDVTAAAVAELDLAPGRRVWLSAKATDVTAYPAP